jgi:glutathione peroxidase
LEVQNPKVFDSPKSLNEKTKKVIDMIKKVFSGLFIFLSIAFSGVLYNSQYCYAANAEARNAEVKEDKNVYDFNVKDIDGNEVALSKYKGKLVLLVNVASRCGLTPQYAGLVELYERYREKGFEILAFPANDFNSQEPGSNPEIKEFCSTKYRVTFPLFAKISVKGESIDPLYAYLTGKETNPEFSGDIEWNFAKFLVNKEGKVVARFGSKVTPTDEAVITAIEKHLKDGGEITHAEVSETASGK